MAVLKHGGAAGGVAAGLHAFLNAELVNGIEFFLRFTGFDKALAEADLVVTGEGSLDEQTLHGKGPFGVAQWAKRRNLPVLGFAGRGPLEHNERLNQYFDALFSIGHEPMDLGTAFQLTRNNLIRISCQVGNMLALGESGK